METIGNDAQISHWRRHLESSLKAVEVSERQLEFLTRDPNQLELDLGWVAIDSTEEADLER